MIELLIFLLFSQKCNINISIGIGAKFYRIATKDNDNVCFNIRSYPFFIIFNEFDNTVVYQQYSTSSIETEYVKTEESLLRFLPVYKMMSSPFEYVVLKTPFATNLSFTVVSLPGMCLNGLYLSNRITDTIVFSKNFDDSTKLFKLNEYDDKCIIYSTPFLKQHAKVEMRSEKNTNQIFIYSDFLKYSSIYGNSSIEQTTGQSPIIINNNPNHNTKKNLFIQPNTFINNAFISEDKLINGIDTINNNKLDKASENIYLQSDIIDDAQVEGPFIIRIIADNEFPPYYVNITFNVEEKNITQRDNNHHKINSLNELLQDDWNEGRSGIYLPPQKIESCPEKKTWHSRNVAIIVIAILFALFLIFVFLITSNALKNNDEATSELIRDRPKLNQTESIESSSLSSFMNAPVLKTLVS